MKPFIDKFKETAASVANLVASITDSIATRRQKISKTLERISFEQSAPVPTAETVARVPDVIDVKGRYWLENHGRSVFTGSYPYESSGLGSPAYSDASRAQLPDMKDWFSVLCVGHPELARQILEGLVTAAMQDVQAGAPSDKRAALLKRLHAELAELERLDEEEVDASAAAGVQITHRPEVLQRRETERLRQERVEVAAAAQRERQRRIDETARARRARGRHSISTYISSGGQMP
jgi:hypothetical protein